MQNIFAASIAHAANVTPLGTIKPGQDPTKIVGPLLGQVIYVLTWVAGFLAVFYLIRSGILYITSAGDPDKAKAARSGILNAVIGIIVIVAAYLIINKAIGIGTLISSGATPS